MPSTLTLTEHVRSVKTIGIVAKADLKNVSPVVREVSKWLAERGVSTVTELETTRLASLKDQRTCSKNDLPRTVDLLLVLGGDGTLLGVANQIVSVDADVPVLAVNCGSLGFLTEITLPELYDALESVLAGTAGIDERQMLRASVLRLEHKEINSLTVTEFEKLKTSRIVAERFVLNDVVIGKSARSNIIEISISVGDQFVTSYRADGLIVSSPTGSTAYNLAVGGPIVHPTVDAFLLTPIAPHTLTNRPIVIASTAPVRVTPALGGEHLEAFASFDGQFNVELEHNDVITVERAPQSLKVVRAESRNYFAVLREKLKWGER